jgi:hypothetical protein
MVNPRVVVYCEGVGEGISTPDDLRGTTAAQGIPGRPIAQELWGTAHLLVARCLEREHQIPFDAIQFEYGLKTERGNDPRGSQLLDKQILRQILSWSEVEGALKPDLVVVFVDSDNEPWQKRLKYINHILREVKRDFPVVGVAHRSFEAWLIADQKILNHVLRYIPSRDFGSPEDLEHGVAKELLNRWIQESVITDRSERALRRELARHCDLDKVSGACASFKAFRKALREVPLP